MCGDGILGGDWGDWGDWGIRRHSSDGRAIVSWGTGRETGDRAGTTPTPVLRMDVYLWASCDAATLALALVWVQKGGGHAVGAVWGDFPGTREKGFTRTGMSQLSQCSLVRTGKIFHFPCVSQVISEAGLTRCSTRRSWQQLLFAA